MNYIRPGGQLLIQWFFGLEGAVARIKALKRLLAGIAIISTIFELDAEMLSAGASLAESSVLPAISVAFAEALRCCLFASAMVSVHAPDFRAEWGSTDGSDRDLSFV